MASICPGRDVAFCPELSPTILEDSGDGFPAQTDCVTLSDSFNLRQAVKSDKGTGSDKRLRIVTAMLRQVFCGAQRHLHLSRQPRCSQMLVHCNSLLAAMNARRHVFVTSDSSTSVKTTLPMPSKPVPTLKKAIGSQVIRSADSHSGKVWSVH